jgi:hypothetical protein
MFRASRSTSSNTSLPIPHWILGALFGTLFYVGLAVAGRISERGLIDWQTNCRNEYYKQLDRFAPPPMEPPPCDRPFQAILSITLWTGPAFLVSVVLPFGNWTTESTMVISSLIFAVIGAICFQAFTPKRGILAFLGIYGLLLIPSFIVNALLADVYM